MKKIVCFLFVLLCSIFIVQGQHHGGPPPPPLTISITEDIPNAKYTVNFVGNMPNPHLFSASVINGTITSYNLPQDDDIFFNDIYYIEVTWNAGATSGSITIQDSYSGASGTLNLVINFPISTPPYCSTISPAKQNLHYGDIPQGLVVPNCFSGNTNFDLIEYQWQIGDVAIGVFPQVPSTWTDLLPVTGVDPTTFTPDVYYANGIKAYRLKTTVTYQGTPYIYYSPVAVISTFNYLSPGAINTTNTIFNNGIPVITQTPAAGGLCDGFSYSYTWEKSLDNTNWTTIGTGVNYPASATLTGPCYIRRKVDCNTEFLYTNSLYINPPPLNAGTISCSNTTLPLNNIPVVTQTAALGSACATTDYTYSWERSVNNGAWVPFGTGINYPATAGIVGTCKIRRKVHCIYEDAYSNEISFTMQAYTSANTENLNYVRVNDIVIPGVQSWEQADGILKTGEKLQTTTYLDGFGRTIQSVIKQGSLIQSPAGLDPNNVNNYQDLVSITQYDGLGRVDKSFLPYATTTAADFFKTNAAAEQQTFNNLKFGEPANSNYTFSQTIYDGSPLNRAINVKLPGAALNNDAGYKGISSDYDFNKLTDNIHIWDIGFNHDDKPQDMGVYADNLLTKSITKDEKDKLVVSYTDLSGHTILKRVQEAASVNDNSYTGWLNTYYVYDDLGQLRYTITPKLVETMAGSSNWTVDNTNRNLCFYQEFDNLGRTILKHAPDGGEVWMVYDNRDRLVFSQDENQRNRSNLQPAKLNQWSFNLYDENDRVLATGLVNDNRNRTTMQAYVDALTLQNQQVQVYTGTNETITPYNPVTTGLTGNIFINAVSYYDDYSHKPATHNSANIGINDFAATGNTYTEAPTISLARISGLVTVSKIRILDANYDDNNSANDQFLSTTSFYDDKGRIVQNYADNIKGGVDASAMLYDFAGKVIGTRSKHNMPGNDFDGLYVVTKNDYDLLGRATKLWKLYTKNSSDISNAAKYKKLSEVKFDELGIVKTKTIGNDPANTGAPLETLDYSYNIQGRLTGINKDYALATGSMSSQWSRRFGFYLGYENGDNFFAGKQYNGSITGVSWRSQGDNIQRKYDYSYDNINRFKTAVFAQKDNGTTGNWSAALVDLSASVSSYDANGNIGDMLQTGIVPGTNGGVTLDNLRYQYLANSNRLQSVIDLASTTVSGKQGDFKDYAATNDYGYDYNGNLLFDKNKNILAQTSSQANATPGAGIISNFLDLPQTITINSKSITEYTYDAAGAKLAKKVTQLTTNPPAPVTTWYIGGMVYQETGAINALQYIMNEEGRLRITDVTPATTPAGVIQGTIAGNVDFGLTAKWGVWDYYLKDNLGNTRMVLTEEGQNQTMICTMENSPAALKTEEEANFGNSTNNEVANTRTTANVPGWTSNPTLASKLQPVAGAGAAIGPNVILKVMAGDIINAKADYYYQAAVPQGQTNVINSIAQSLLGALTGSTVTGDGIKSGIDASYLQNTTTGPLQPFLYQSQPATTGNTPRAYLNYIFFDEQFRYVSQSSNAQMVTVAGDNHAPVMIPQNTAKATKNGYVYVYLSNETPNMPVYFDNFQVVHTRESIVEDNAYYPFGLKIQGISSRAAGKPLTKEGYQGDYNEQDAETGYDEFDLRSYDPQIGRWIQVDPKIVQPGMYNGMGNDPVNQIDPDGGGPPDWGSYLDKNGVLHAINSSQIFDQASAEAYATSVGGTAGHYIGKTGTWISNIHGTQFWNLLENGDHVQMLMPRVTPNFDDYIRTYVNATKDVKLGAGIGFLQQAWQTVKGLAILTTFQSNPGAALDPYSSIGQAQREVMQGTMLLMYQAQTETGGNIGAAIARNYVTAASKDYADGDFYDATTRTGKIAFDFLTLYGGGEASVTKTSVAAEGGSNVKYLGRMEDLQGIPRSQTILDELPNLGSHKANYYQNMSVIRRNLREGVIFKDASWFRPNSELAPTLKWPTRTVGQTFYGAERNLMKNRGLWP